MGFHKTVRRLLIIQHHIVVVKVTGREQVQRGSKEGRARSFVFFEDPVENEFVQTNRVGSCKDIESGDSHDNKTPPEPIISNLSIISMSPNSRFQFKYNPIRYFSSWYFPDSIYFLSKT